jgi:hypothetical protein
LIIVVSQIEIYGILNSTNGRLCVTRFICGEHLNAGDLICFRSMVVDDVDGAPESAIATVCILDGTETCIVGFLPLSIVLWRGRDFIGEFAQIIELYAHSKNPVLRRKSHQNFGVASFCMLQDIPQEE